MRVGVVGTALVNLASAVSAQQLNAPVTKPTEDEIVVRGQRNERYRIPPALRTLPAERSERWRQSVSRDLGCQHVGPRGCGTPVLPIFTVTGDGKVRIGQDKDSAK